MDYTFNVPINSVSFGAVSIALLRESYKAGHSPCIIPIGGQVDISSQKEDKDFTLWLQAGLNKGLKTHKRNFSTLKLWHLSGGIESLSNKQVLYSFYELDSPTLEEVNTVQNNYKVLFPCDYNTNTFKDYGCANVETVPLGFDSFNFYDTKKTYFTDGRISFLIGGKWEPVRKKTDKVIQTWLKKFGGNPKYFLNCAIHNNFVHPDQHKQIYNNIVQGKNYGNIQFLPFLPQNSAYNDLICASDVVLGLGTESWGIPEFSATSLGKHSVISNYAGHKQWVTQGTSALVAPSSKTLAYDNMFFHPNQPFNQGSVYDFSEDSLIQAFEEVIKRVESNRVNTKGLELQQKFTYKNTFDKIYQLLQE